ncbi:MAG: DEAD/DEAH box helicase, partial [Pseudomonadales bacterium]
MKTSIPADNHAGSTAGSATKRPADAPTGKTANSHADTAKQAGLQNAIALTRISGIGPALLGRLQKLGIDNLVDLLFHLPLRYEDRTRVQKIASLRAGSGAVIEGDIRGVRPQYGKRRSLLCQLADDSGVIDLRFFHFSKAQQQSLEHGARLRCYGEVSIGQRGLCMIHPEYTFAQAETEPASRYLTAIYPSTEGLQQGRWRSFIEQAFRLLPRAALQELLSDTQLTRAGLAMGGSLYQALHTLHFPPHDIDLKCLQQGAHPAQRRLAFEELLAQRLSHLQIKRTQRRQVAPALLPDAHYAAQLEVAIGFILTAAQRRVRDEIGADLAQPFAMLRLLQGDVGSGKTVVAAFAALQAIAAGAQAALMAPTEILAEQHAVSLQRWL